MSRYSTEEGAKILAEVHAHPKRALIEAVAEATYDLANEDGTGSGGGMWWHLSWAYSLVEALPELTLRDELALSRTDTDKITEETT